MDFLLPGIINSTSYNSGLTWSSDERRLVFMSNGGSGNYDLYLLPAIGKEETVRLTEHPQKDSHPHWSPTADQLVFVSGRTGTADVFSMTLASHRMVRLTNGGKTNLYPQWSPDGKKIAWIYGSNENHDIHLIADLQRPEQTHDVLIRWAYDDLRPMWSPDGTQIAFYSNYNPQSDPKIWSIVVVAADGSDPSEGPELVEKVVAQNVIPDIEQGPAWMPDSRRIIYVKNDAQTYNPLFLVDIQDKQEVQIDTGTRMNHDVVCAADGTFAFRAQTEQWDHIYLAKLKE
jgi:TolB protein